MEKTKIQPTEKSETVNFGNKLHNNFWIPKNDTVISISGHKERILQLLHDTTEGFVCVYSEKLSDKDIIKKIFDRSKSGIKVYILVNEYTNELEHIKNQVLIRYGGTNNVGSFILQNPKSDAAQGIFFAGQLTEASLLLKHFSKIPTKLEIKELFVHFCYQFWQNATTEIIKGEAKSIQSKPIDVYYDSNKFSGKDYVWGTLFNFVDSDSRCKLSAQKIVSINQEKQLPTEIKSSFTKNLGLIKSKELMSQKEFEIQKPEFKDDGVSVEINYTWTNVPFYLPDNYKSHNLYSQWENEKKKISDKLSSLLNSISEMENKENTFSKRIARFFLSKKQKFNELREQVKRLQSIDYANTCSEDVKNKENEINEISQKIAMHGVEIDNENKKARIEEEIDELKAKLDDKKKELSAKEEEIQSKKSNNDDDTFISKAETEKKLIEKDLKNLENQINSKRKEIGKTNTEQQSSDGSSLEVFNTKGNNKNTKPATSKQQFEIQKLPQLPQVGKLFTSGGHSYLAIEFWEDYELGKIEAERLKAKLCATK